MVKCDFNTGEEEWEGYGWFDPSNPEQNEEVRDPDNCLHGSACQITDECPCDRWEIT